MFSDFVGDYRSHVFFEEAVLFLIQLVLLAIGYQCRKQWRLFLERRKLGDSVAQCACHVKGFVATSTLGAGQLKVSSDNGARTATRMHTMQAGAGGAKPAQVARPRMSGLASHLDFLPSHLVAEIMHGFGEVRDWARLATVGRTFLKQIWDDSDIWLALLATKTQCQIPPMPPLASALRRAFRLQHFGVEDFTMWQQRPGVTDGTALHAELLREATRAIQGLVKKDGQELCDRVGTAVLVLLRWCHVDQQACREGAEALIACMRSRIDIFGNGTIYEAQEALRHSYALHEALTSAPEEVQAEDTTQNRQAALSTTLAAHDRRAEITSDTDSNSATAARNAPEADALDMIFGTLRSFVDAGQVRKVITPKEEAELTAHFALSSKRLFEVAPPNDCCAKGRKRFSSPSGQQRKSCSVRRTGTLTVRS